MPSTLAVKPVRRPVTAKNVMDFLRIDSDSDIDQVEAIIDSATDMFERYTGRGVIEQEWVDTFEKFDRKLRLSKAPFAEIVKVEYHDESNELVEAPSGLYWAVQAYGSQPASVILKQGEEWPQAITGRPDAVKVHYKVGYGDKPEDVPANIRHTIKMLCVHFYENRSPVVANNEASNDVPFTLQAGLDQFRVMWQ